MTKSMITTVAALILGAFLFARETSRQAYEAHSRAAIRLIGEAVEKGDIEAVRAAIVEYRKQNEAPAVIVQQLAKKTRQ